MPSALSAPSSPHGSLRSTSPVSPEVCVSNMRTVTLCTLRIVRRVEVRQILLHGIVELNLALFVKLHDGGRRCEDLRQRRHVEDRVLGHRLSRCRRSVQSRLACKLARAISLVKDDLAAVPDHNHSTWQLMCRNRIVHQLGDCCEVRCARYIWRQRGRRGHIGRQRRRNWRLPCLRAVGYGCVRCIATRGSRSECKQDSSNSNGLPHRWHTEHKAGKRVNGHVEVPADRPATRRSLGAPSPARRTPGCARPRRRRSRCRVGLLAWPPRQVEVRVRRRRVRGCPLAISIGRKHPL